MAINDLQIGTTFTFTGKCGKQLYPKKERKAFEWSIIVFNNIQYEPKYTQVIRECIHPIYKSLIIMGANFPELEEGLKYTLTVEVKQGKKGGEKILNVLHCFEMINLLDSTEDAHKFLGSILTENQVTELFNTLDNPIRAIKTKDVLSLTAVKGIGEKVANSIIKKYEENVANANVIVLLYGCGVSPQSVQSLVNAVGDATTLSVMIKKNPYSLTKFRGIGFKRADSIALKLGLEPNDIRRLEAYVLYKLEEGGQSGFSWIDSRNLLQLINADLGNLFSLEAITSVITKLKQEKKVWNEKKGVVALTKYYMLEREIALELARIQLAEKPIVQDWEQRIDHLEQSLGWTYTTEQRSAIKDIIHKTLVIVTGGAGTGKTTTVLGAKKAQDNLSFAQCCLAGKGASRMHESSGYKASTIHRLLGVDMSPQTPNVFSKSTITHIKPKEENGQAEKWEDLIIKNSGSNFSSNSHNPLGNDIIFVDEFSMIGGELFLSLLKAIKTGATLVLIGDAGQLPAIGALNVGGDLIGHKDVNTARLTKIHRQAKESDIIMKSKDVNEGKQLFDINYVGTGISGVKKDFEWDISDNNSVTVNKTVHYFKKYLEKAQDVMEIQILAPTKKSVSAINQAVKNVYNPRTATKPSIEKRDEVGNSVYISIGDKVINTKNDYGSSVYMEGDNEKAETVDIFNGFVGTVIDIVKDEDDKDDTLVIYYPIVDRKVSVPKIHWNDSIQLAYAITCHKAQGSEFDYVICAIDMSHYGSLMSAGREMTYTMFTRASKHLVVVAQNSALHFAIKTTAKNFKQTFLPMLIKPAQEYVQAKNNFYKRNPDLKVKHDNSVMSDIVFQSLNPEFKYMDLDMKTFK